VYGFYCVSPRGFPMHVYRGAPVYNKYQDPRRRIYMKYVRISYLS
jgi:hypothetical protein